MVGALAYEDVALAVRRQTIRKIQLPDARTLAAKCTQEACARSSNSSSTTSNACSSCCTHNLPQQSRLSPDCTTTATTTAAAAAAAAGGSNPLLLSLSSAGSIAQKAWPYVQRLLRELAQGRWFQYLAGISATAAVPRRLRCGGRSKRRDGYTEPLDLCDDVLPLVKQGYRYLVLEGLVGMGRGVVALEPVLHVLVVVRVPVGCGHRVVHQRAQERYASQLLCTASREPHTPPTRMHYRPLQTREVTRSYRAVRRRHLSGRGRTSLNSRSGGLQRDGGQREVVRTLGIAEAEVN